MAVNKELKFNFSLDDQSFIKVKAALESLTNQAKELAKAMNAAGGGAGSLLTGAVGGTTGSKPSGMSAAASGASSSSSSSKFMVQNVQATAEAYKRLSAISVGAMRAMEDSTRRTFTEQKTRVKELEGQIVNLGRAYERMADKSSEAAKDLAEQIKGVTDEVLEADKKLSQMGGGTAGVGPKSPPTGANRGAGGVGQIISQIPGFGHVGGLMQGLGGAMGVAGGAVAAGGYGIYTGLKSYQSIQGARMGLAAERGAMTNQLVGGIQGGDRSQLVLMQRMRNSAVANPEEFTKQYGGAAYTLLQQVGAQAANIKGAFTGGHMMNAKATALETERFKDFQGTISTFANTAEGGAALRGNQLIQGSLGERIGYNRFFGGGQNRIKTDRHGLVFGSSKTDEFLNQKTALEEKGYSLSEKQGAAMQAMGIGGMALRSKFSGTIMSANAGGFGQLGDVLGMTARAYGHTLMGDEAQTSRAARGFFGGGIDPIAAMHLAQITTRGGFDVSGTTSGQGMLAAIQSGSGFGRGIQDLQEIQRIQAGVSGANKALQGGSGFNQGYRTLAAISAAPGASTYLQDYLASGMNIQQIMDAARGQGTEMFRELGGDKSMAQSMIGAMGEDYLTAYQEQGGKNNNVDAAVSRWKSSGMSLGEYKKKNPRDSKLLGMAISLGSGGYISEEEGKGMMGFGDPNSAIKEGKLPGAGKLDQISQKLLTEAANVQKDAISAAYKDIGAIISSNDKALAQMADVFQQFGTSLEKSAAGAANALWDLAGGAEAAKRTLKNASTDSTITKVISTATGVAATILGGGIGIMTGQDSSADPNKP